MERRMRTMTVWALVLTALTGCFSYDPQPATGGGAGGGLTGGGGGATGGGGGQGSTVTVRRVVTYFFEGGSRDEPSRFSGPTELLVHAGADWQVIQGSLADAGVYVFSNVPAGERYLRYGKAWLHAPGDEVNLAEDSMGRVAAQTDGGTSLRVMASGLPAWPDFSLQYVATNIGVVGFGAEQAVLNPPAAGLSPSDLTFDYLALRGTTTLALPDTTAGDTVFLSVFEGAGFTTDAGVVLTATSLSRATTLSPLVLTDHATTTVTAAFAPVVQEHFAVDWRRSAFWDFGVEMHPAVNTRNQSYDSLTVSAEPYTSQHGMYASTPDLAWLDGYSSGDRTDLQVTLSAGNPYPQSWDRTVSATHCFYAAREEVAVDAGTYSPNACLTLMDLWTRRAGQPLRPSLSPPQQLLVDGQSAAGSRTLSSATPRLSWTAPRTGTPTMYVVKARRLFLNGSSWSSTSDATLRTTATSLTVPPGVLTSGQAYVLEVDAVSGFAASAPFRATFPEEWAPTVTSVLRVP